MLCEDSIAWKLFCMMYLSVVLGVEKVCSVVILLWEMML